MLRVKQETLRDKQEQDAAVAKQHAEILKQQQDLELQQRLAQTKQAERDKQEAEQRRQLDHTNKLNAQLKVGADNAPAAPPHLIASTSPSPAHISRLQRYQLPPQLSATSTSNYNISVMLLPAHFDTQQMLQQQQAQSLLQQQHSLQKEMDAVMA